MSMPCSNQYSFQYLSLGGGSGSFTMSSVCIRGLGSVDWSPRVALDALACF